MIARWTARIRRQARPLLQWLAPAGSWRQRIRFQLTDLLRWLALPRRPRDVPTLPDFRDAAAVETYLANFDLRLDRDGAADRVYHWLDFRPHVWAMFPLATTPAQRAEFAAWLFTNWTRLAVGRGCASSTAMADASPTDEAQPRPTGGLRVADVVAFLAELANDPTYGIEPLYRRNAAWQRDVPDGLGSRWDGLKRHLAASYRIVGDWLEIASPPEPAPATTPGVNLLAHFCYPSGLQVAAINTRDALMLADWDVSCRDVPNNGRTDLPVRREFLGLHPHPITIVQIAPEPLGKNAYLKAGLAERAGTYRIGYWYWELDRVPARWRRQKDWLHELWAPTRFVGDALRLTMPMRVVDVLPGMRMPPRIENPRLRVGLPGDRFVFLFAFDMSSTAERKNPGAVVAAFRRAFAPSDPATLVVKVSRGWEDADALAELRRAAEPGRIVVIDETMSVVDFYGLMNQCDAYVSLHRSEGFGLTMAEAMALAKPTIATGYSGNLDFMTEDNSFLVAFELTTLRRTVKSYAKGTRWAEPSIDDAAAKMRWVFENRVAAQAIADRGQATVREVLSLEAAAERMTKRLREIRP